MQSTNLQLAKTEFEKAASIYPRETYYKLYQILLMAQEIRNIKASGNKEKTKLIYQQILDISEQIENKVWCPDELYLKLAAAASFMGLLSDSIVACEESLKWDKYSIDARFMLSTQYKLHFIFTEETEALELSFVNACIACDLLKYHAYYKPNYFQYAIETGIQLYNLTQNDAVLKKINDLSFILAKSAPIKPQFDKTIEDVCAITDKKTKHNNLARASLLIYAHRKGNLQLNQVETEINSMLNLTHEKKKEILTFLKTIEKDQK